MFEKYGKAVAAVRLKATYPSNRTKRYLGGPWAAPGEQLWEVWWST